MLQWVYPYIHTSEREKVNMVLNVQETVRLIRDGEERGYGGGGRGILYTYRYTVTTGMTSALRWAAMRAILTFQ